MVRRDSHIRVINCFRNGQIIFRDSGALGSRLSGAGWGGCTISQVPADKVESFIEKVKKGYYIGRPHREKFLAESLFATEPGSGAAIFKGSI